MRIQILDKHKSKQGDLVGECMAYMGQLVAQQGGIYALDLLKNNAKVGTV